MTMSIVGRFAALDDMQITRSQSLLKSPKRLIEASRERQIPLTSVRLALPFPLAGTAAVIWFDSVALKTLRNELGSDYLTQIDAGLAEHNPSIIKMLLDASLRNADVSVDDIVEMMPLADVATIIIDALSLRLYGKRVSAKSAEDVFIQKAQAVKIAISHVATEGAEITKNADGTATLDVRLAPLVGFLLAGLDDI